MREPKEIWKSESVVLTALVSVVVGALPSPPKVKPLLAGAGTASFFFAKTFPGGKRKGN